MVYRFPLEKSFLFNKFSAKIGENKIKTEIVPVKINEYWRVSLINVKAWDDDWNKNKEFQEIKGNVAEVLSVYLGDAPEGAKIKVKIRLTS